jgi:hypothetical protein
VKENVCDWVIMFNRLKIKAADNLRKKKATDRVSHYFRQHWTEKKTKKT